ncbi:hypothetical protein AX16_008533 [Volvariella volvacea WC 439]|nr:hypothetical protein AX16_008533 [Volvariella volvacea WC 439]
MEAQQLPVASSIEPIISSLQPSSSDPTLDAALPAASVSAATLPSQSPDSSTIPTTAHISPLSSPTLASSNPPTTALSPVTQQDKPTPTDHTLLYPSSPSEPHSAISLHSPHPLLPNPAPPSEAPNDPPGFRNPFSLVPTHEHKRIVAAIGPPQAPPTHDTQVPQASLPPPPVPQEVQELPPPPPSPPAPVSVSAAPVAAVAPLYEMSEELQQQVRALVAANPSIRARVAEIIEQSPFVQTRTRNPEISGGLPPPSTSGSAIQPVKPASVPQPTVPVQPHLQQAQTMSHQHPAYMPIAPRPQQQYQQPHQTPPQQPHLVSPRLPHHPSPQQPYHPSPHTQFATQPQIAQQFSGVPPHIPPHAEALRELIQSYPHLQAQIQAASQRNQLHGYHQNAQSFSAPPAPSTTIHTQIQNSPPAPQPIPAAAPAAAQPAASDQQSRSPVAQQILAPAASLLQRVWSATRQNLEAELQKVQEHHQKLLDEERRSNRQKVEQLVRLSQELDKSKRLLVSELQELKAAEAERERERSAVYQSLVSKVAEVEMWKRQAGEAGAENDQLKREREQLKMEREQLMRDREQLLRGKEQMRWSTAVHNNNAEGKVKELEQKLEKKELEIQRLKNEWAIATNLGKVFFCENAKLRDRSDGQAGASISSKGQQGKEQVRPGDSQSKDRASGVQVSRIPVEDPPAELSRDLNHQTDTEQSRQAAGPAVDPNRSSGKRKLSFDGTLLGGGVQAVKRPKMSILDGGGSNNMSLVYTQAPMLQVRTLSADKQELRSSSVQARPEAVPASSDGPPWEYQPSPTLPSPPPPVVQAQPNCPAQEVRQPLVVDKMSQDGPRPPTPTPSESGPARSLSIPLSSPPPPAPVVDPNVIDLTMDSP